jgi:carbamoyltransferase
MNTLGVTGVDRGFAVSLVQGTGVVFAIEEDKLRRFRGLGFRDLIEIGSRAVDLAVDRSGDPSAVDEIAFVPAIDADEDRVAGECRAIAEYFFRSYGIDVPVRPVDHVAAHVAFERAVNPGADSVLMVGSSRAVLTTKSGRTTLDRPFAAGAFVGRSARFLGLDRSRIHHLENLARFGDEADVDAFLSLMNDEGVSPTPDGERERFARIEAIVGAPRRYRGVGLEKGHFDLAASLFAVLRESVRQVLEDAAPPRGETIALSGGVFQSWRLNDAMAEHFPDHHLVVSFAPGNAGCAIGGPLVGRSRDESKPLTPFLGPRYGRDEVKGVLDNSKARYSLESPGAAASLVSDALSQGKMVGWFSGACEFGYRALGARSVFANPADPYACDNLSSFLKRRPAYFTYAVAARDDHASAAGIHSPYLTRSTSMPEYFKDTPVRIQTVSKAMNPGLFQLLGAFERREGVPVLLNTSLNYFDEPIACTPRDALKTFHASGLDLLVMEGFALRKY